MTKNKKNLGLKVLSTTAAIAMLASSVATPVSVFAAEMDQASSGKIGSTRALVGSGDFNISQYLTHTVSYGESAASVKSSLISNHVARDKVTGRYVYPSNVTYSPSINTSVAGLKGVSITVYYNDSKLSGSLTYSSYIRVSENPNGNGNGNANATEEFQIKMTSAIEKTIEYGTKFNPLTEFTGYVLQVKENLVYGSVSTYEGTYKDGVKPGTYSGNMRFKQGPSTSVFFNLTTPVKIMVVNTLLNEATQLVNDLFTDKTNSSLKEQITQKDIDSVLAKVNALPNTSEKDALLTLMEKAQELLNHGSIEHQAEEIVNNLFADDEHTTLAEGVTQEDIDAAKEAVNKVTDEAKKEELLNEIEKAQDLLAAKEDANKAEENVNNLFADDEHTTLAEGVTQEDIDAAKEAVNKVTDEAKKEELLNEIQKAQDLLAAKEDANKAEENVNNLFADDEHTTLAEGVTQEDIDAAKEAVNKVTDEAKKEELLNEIEKAQDLLNEMNKLTLNELTVISKTISSSAIANSQIRISINGVAKTVIKADAQGNYEWKAPKLTLNDVIKVEMRNPKTNKYDQFVNQRITENGVTEEKITLNEMQEGDTKLSGKTTPNAQVRISFDGTAKNVVTSDAQGNYEFFVASGLKTGTEIKVELKANGTYSVSETATVIARVLTLNPITSADDVVISGKTRNPNQKLRISLNGKAKTIISSKEGVYEYRMGKLAADSVIKVEAMNGSTVIESVEQIVKGISNEERPDVKLDAIEAGTKTIITGKAPENAALRISINGKTKSVVAADAEGNFSYMLGKVQAGDKVKIEIREGKTFVFATEVVAH